MLKYQYIIYSSEETFTFRLKEDKVFVLEKNFGKWNLIDSHTNSIMAICKDNIITIKSGYMWDGCTIVRKYYEDPQTLEASLLHDVLYNAKKNPKKVEVPFSLFEADKVFAKYLSELCKEKNEGFFKSKVFPFFYYLGLITIGIPWKHGTNNYYELTIN